MIPAEPFDARLGWLQPRPAGRLQPRPAGWLRRGEIHGQRQALWLILAARSISVDAEMRARIEACRDADLLRRWVSRAITSATAAELFVPEPEAPKDA